jgi:hypothetical protein
MRRGEHPPMFLIYFLILKDIFFMKDSDFMCNSCQCQQEQKDLFKDFKIENGTNKNDQFLNKMKLKDGRMGLEDNNVSTKLVDKSYSPAIVRKYTRIGFPLYIHIISDYNLNDLDNVVNECINFCKEKGIIENKIQSLRNFVGFLSDWINTYYDELKYGCIESLGVIFYADKMLISSLSGDCMNHSSCRDELYHSLNLMAKI